jgi:hypothetical protein
MKSSSEHLPDPPKYSPVFYLADLMTGYFAAAGMMAALHRRALEPDPPHRRPPRALRRGPRAMAAGDSGARRGVNAS